MKTYIVSTITAGYGFKKITISYRGKLYSAETSNMPLFDTYNSETFTRKQEADQKRAEKDLIRFVKNANNLH